jgi:hypothetical protein
MYKYIYVEVEVYLWWAARTILLPVDCTELSEAVTGSAECSS